MERSCELCRRSPARMFCDSDEARLCWDCDEKVHGANFLVAKHSRTLLCNSCQSPTPWKASGTKLSHTISVCEGCFEICNNPADAGSSGRPRIREPPCGEEEEDGGDDTGVDGGDDTGVDDGDDEDSDSSSESLEEEEEEDGENQVVPWASCCPSPSVSSAAPPLATSSSESFSSRNDAVKRSWSNRISDSEDDDASCSSQGNSIMAVSVNPAKRRQADGGDGGGGRDNDHGESAIIRRISELRDAA